MGKLTFWTSIRHLFSSCCSGIMRRCNSCFRVLLGLIGIALCGYTLHVEHSAMTDKTYKAMCDISEQISCTKAFLSKYGRGFGLVEPLLGKESPLNLPNPVYGLGFYGIIVVLSFFSRGRAAISILTLMALTSCVTSVYLATVLIEMNDFCVVCISTYLVNFMLLISCLLECCCQPTNDRKHKRD